MYLLRAIILWLTPVAVLAYFWAIHRHYELWVGAGVALVIFLTVGLRFLGAGRWNRNFGYFVLLPGLWLVSGAGFNLFLVNVWQYFFVAAVLAGGLYFLYRQYYFFFHFPFRYVPYSLENLAYYLGVGAMFFASAATFAAHMLLKFPLWQITPAYFLFVLLLTYQFFWTHKVEWSKAKWFISVIALTAAELFLVFAFLPTAHFVNGAILAVSYYVMAGLAKCFLANQLDKKHAVGYLVMAVVSVLAVVLTARWS